jgi:nucleoside-diphosphate-sugar epimerase
MNILLTGATGFIGRHLVRRLINDGQNVFCTLKKEEEPPSGVVKSICFEQSKGIEIIDFFQINNIEGVVHLASVILDTHKLEDIENIIDSNVKFGSLLLEYCVQAKSKWFINTGTFWQNYENTDYSPVNFYAASKQAFESIAQYYIDSNQIEFFTIRLFDTFGENDSRPKILNLWDKHAKNGEVLNMSPGEQLIDISYIGDIIDAYIILIKHVSADLTIIKNGSVFTVSAEKRYTLKELAKIFEETTSQKLYLNWGGRKYKEREVMVPWEKGKPVPGWKPKYSIQDAIKKVFKY